MHGLVKWTGLLQVDLEVPFVNSGVVWVEVVHFVHSFAGVTMLLQPLTLLLQLLPLK